MTSIRARTLRWRRGLDDRGMPLVEFAFVLPFLVTLALGMIEVGIYTWLTLKLQNTAANLANLATRDAELSQAGIEDVFVAAETNMAPFDLGPKAAFLVTAVAADDQGNPAVAWRRSGAGSLAENSRLGDIGNLADLPADISVDEASIIAVEAFYRYEEMLLGIVPDRIVYRTAFFRPRFGALSEPQ